MSGKNIIVYNITLPYFQDAASRPGRGGYQLQSWPFLNFRIS